jgi:hypothetical protein
MRLYQIINESFASHQQISATPFETFATPEAVEWFMKLEIAKNFMNDPTCFDSSSFDEPQPYLDDLEIPHFDELVDLYYDDEAEFLRSDMLRQALMYLMREQYRDAQWRIARMPWRGGLLAVSRFIEVPTTDWPQALVQRGGGPLGIHWTYDRKAWKEIHPDGVGAVWGTGYGVTFRIDGTVQDSAVDWSATLWNQMDIGGHQEFEATLRKGAPVRVTALKVVGNGKKAAGLTPEVLAELSFTA